MCVTDGAEHPQTIRFLAAENLSYFALVKAQELNRVSLSCSPVTLTYEGATLHLGNLVEGD